MRIVLLNTWDCSGGAARAAFRLFRGLEDAGCEMAYLVRDRVSAAERVTALDDFSGQERILEKLVQQHYLNANRTERSNTAFTFTLAGTGFAGYPDLAEADVINLHWVEKFLSLRSLDLLAASGKPLVWTLHDQRPFTGGCHYAAGCDGFQDNCRPCPQLRDDPFLLPHRVLLETETILRDADLTVVAPSRWLAEEAKKSRLFRDRRVEVIPNGVETEVFAPVNRDEARRWLGIDRPGPALLFGAERHGEKRKGFAALMAAMRICLKDQRFAQLSRQGEILVLTVGAADGEVEDLGLPVHHFGYINDDRLMAAVYGAADMFILPSLEDNLPNTMLEAMACGTPVIGFRTGGIPDLVRHGENGLLAGCGDPAELAAMILTLVFDAGARERFGTAARTRILEHCTQARQAAAYAGLFREIAGQRRDNGGRRAAASELPPERYDSLFGAALRLSLANMAEGREVPAGCPVCSDAEQHGRYLDLRQAVADLCRVHALRHPRRKLAAYRRVLRSYRRIR